MPSPDLLQIRSQKGLIELLRQAESSPAIEMTRKDWDEVRRRVIASSRVRFNKQNRSPENVSWLPEIPSAEADPTKT
jgi:hypothetical protein